MLKLPYDILELLISSPLLSKGDLKCLSLVSKGFVQASQQKLYERVSPTLRDRCGLLDDTLSSSPHIARYIKNLDVESDFHNPHLPRVIKKANNLQSLALGTPQIYSLPGPGRSTQQSVWAQMSHEFKGAIELALQLPSLKRLVLNHWIFPSPTALAILFDLIGDTLESLSLYIITFDPSERAAGRPKLEYARSSGGANARHPVVATVHGAPNRKRVSPRHLALAMKGSHTGDVGWNLLEFVFGQSENRILDLSRTTSFTFGGTRMQEHGIAEAVANIGACAHSLRISPLSFLPGDKEPSVSFHTNTAVSSLTIDYSNGGYASGLSKNPLQHISACLATFQRTDNSVRRICLRMGPICIAMARRKTALAHLDGSDFLSNLPRRRYEELEKEGAELVELADVVARTFTNLALFEFFILGQNNEKKASCLRDDVETLVSGRWQRTSGGRRARRVELKVEIVQPAWQFF